MENEFAQLRTALARQREEVADRLLAAEAGARELRDARGASDTDDEHDPEGSTVSWDLATHKASTAASARHLAEIDAALERLAQGWDGSCAECGQQIPTARLMARPSAHACVDCAGASR